MLSALSVRNIVLIDQLDLDLSRGLSVLTGETGAGKSILLDALSLALGARGDQGLVRQGQQSGQVTAVFDLSADHAAVQLLVDSDVDVQDSLILRRVQFADGRSKAYVNDQPVSARLMQQLGQLLVEIHGQHADRALVDSDAHREILDAFGGLGNQSTQVAQSFAILSKAERDLDAQRAKVARIAEEEDFARHVVAELEEFDLVENEEELLSARRHELMQLEKAIDDVRSADDVLHGNDGPTDQIAGLMRSLERKGAGDDDLYQDLLSALGETMDGLGRASEALRDIQQRMNFDPEELNQVEERLFALRALARKHDVACDQLPEILAKYQQELAMLGEGTDLLAELEAAVVQAREAYQAGAAKLSSAREQVGKQLEKAVEKELPDLKLGAAQFFVDLDRDESRVSAHGFDAVSFLVQTNPGSRAGPILKVASGGELSRFLLALKVVLAEKGSAPVLIFDEVDTGVGGAVADAIGRRLARLAERLQVLTVTHAPQVAARATQHMLIEKQSAKTNGKEAETTTSVRPLAANERDEELARMLAGAAVTDEARAAARRLVAEVG